MRMLFSGLVVAAAVALSAPAIAASVMSPAGVAAAVNDTGVSNRLPMAVVPAGGADRMALDAAGRCARGVGRCRAGRAAVVVVPRPRWCHGPYTSRNFRC